MEIDVVIKTVFDSLEIIDEIYKANDKLLMCPTWDSLGILSIIGNFKEKFQINLNIKDLNKLETFGDLFSYIISQK